jgi:hypothetical protein
MQVADYLSAFSDQVRVFSLAVQAIFTDQLDRWPTCSVPVRIEPANPIRIATAISALVTPAFPDFKGIAADTIDTKLVNRLDWCTQSHPFFVKAQFIPTLSILKSEHCLSSESADMGSPDTWQTDFARFPQ